MDEVIVWWGVDFGRAIHWRIPFMALDGTSYQVNIYEEGYDGNVVVLKGGAEPFITEETDDADAFLPIRSSSGYINVICEDAALVNQILPVDVLDRYVELYNVTSRTVAWNGYILPSEYSGEWNTTPYELQLPVASPIAACLDLKYEGVFRAVTIGDALKKMLYDQMKVAPSFIMSGKFAAQTASFLTAVFSDIQFAEIDSSILSPAYGTGQNVEFRYEYSTIGDVLEAICKLYGYVIHETPDALWFCSSDMSTSYYQTEINYDPNDDYLQSETTIVVSDVDMPDTVASYNSRSLLPGKSKIRVFCEAEEVGTILNDDFSELEQASYYSNRNGNPINFDDGIHCYIRKNRLGKHALQYTEQSPAPLSNVNMFGANATVGDQDVWGANFFSYAKWKKPDVVWKDEYDKYKDVIMLGISPTSTIQTCVILNSPRAYSAMNFVRNGIYLDMKAVISKVLDDLDFKYKFTDFAHFRLSWGGYYFVPSRNQTIDKTDGTWQQNPENNVMSVRFGSGDPREEEGQSIMVGISQGWIPAVFMDTRDIHVIPVKPENAAEINGYITLEILTFSHVYQNDIKYLWLQGLELRNNEFSQQSLGDPTDHFLSDFRRQLSNAKAEEYEYEMPLNNTMADYSPSGVIPPATVQDTPADYYEQTILDRLSDWYDRTIEQLTVTVEYTNINPGQRIEYDNSLYIVVSRADNWRDSNVTLTLQKMYEPQAEN